MNPALALLAPRVASRSGTGPPASFVEVDLASFLDHTPQGIEFSALSPVCSPLALAHRYKCPKGGFIIIIKDEKIEVK